MTLVPADTYADWRLTRGDTDDVQANVDVPYCPIIRDDAQVEALAMAARFIVDHLPGERMVMIPEWLVSFEPRERREG